MSGNNVDISILMIRVSFSFHLKEHVVVDIDGEEYLLVLREDTYGPVCIVRQKLSTKSSSSSKSDEYCSNYDEELLGEKSILVLVALRLLTKRKLQREGRRVCRRR